MHLICAKNPYLKRSKHSICVPILYRVRERWQRLCTGAIMNFGPLAYLGTTEVMHNILRIRVPVDVMHGSSAGCLGSRVRRSTLALKVKHCLASPWHHKSCKPRHRINYVYEIDDYSIYNAAYTRMVTDTISISMKFLQRYFPERALRGSH